MTEDNKQLLLKDLCAKLPYGIIVHIHDIDVDDYDRRLIGEDLDFIELDRKNCKPYLRPMSSMTEDEEREFEETLQYTQHTLETYDWLNAHHFDYRGLIPMGLALEAPEEIYKTK